MAWTHGEFDRIFTKDKPVIFAYPRLSLSHPPADLQTHKPRKYPRARLHRGRNDDDAFRHDGAERARPLPSRHRSHRARAGIEGEGAGRCRPAACETRRTPRLRPGIWRGHARGQKLEMAGVMSRVAADPAFSRLRRTPSTPARTKTVPQIAVRVFPPILHAS